MAAIRSHRQIRAYFQDTMRRPRAHSHHTAILFQEACHFGLHAQFELRVQLPFFRKEIQEIPLRHQREKFAMSWKMRKIGDGYYEILDLTADLGQLLMRPAQEIVQQSKLVHQLERRRMNRVPAKITQKIRVLFEDHYIDSGASEQKPQHHSRRSATRNATTDLQ